VRTDTWPQTSERAARRQSPLLPPAARPAAAVIGVLCVAATLVMIVLFWHGTGPSWADSVVDGAVHRVLPWARRRPLRDIADLGNPAWVIVLTAVLAAGCLVLGRFRAAVLAAVSVPAAAAVTELLKPVVDRRLSGAPGYPSGVSFPSGHASGLFSLAAVLCVLVMTQAPRMRRAVRLLIALAGFLVAAAVAVAVIALYRHYFTDTVAAAAISIAVVLCVAYIVDLPRWRAGPAGVIAWPGAARRLASPRGPGGHPD